MIIAFAWSWNLDDIDFSTSKGFNFATLLISITLAAFYICWW